MTSFQAPPTRRDGLITGGRIAYSELGERGFRGLGIHVRLDGPQVCGDGFMILVDGKAHGMVPIVAVTIAPIAGSRIQFTLPSPWVNVLVWNPT